LYEIVNRNSGLAISVAGSSNTLGAAIEQAPYAGGADQAWISVEVSAGQYTLINEVSGLALGEPGTPIAQKQPLQLVSPNNIDNGGDPRQEWRASSAGGGYYTLTNVATGDVADVAGSSTSSHAPIIQWTNQGDASQEWALIVVR
jgi:hypothetical protein